MTQNKTYRPHIDGLRAIAVLGVILFHLKLIPVGHFAVPGGFTGVDIFFVISGFLISKIIFADLDAGSFSFLDFYARRARRILPAMLLVSSLTMIAGLFALHPIEFEQLSHSYLAAIGSVANVYFYATTSYFGPGASDLPLLHLWSLGVEEQFYLVFPVIVVLLWRFGRKMIIPAMAMMFAASLAYAQMKLATDPPAAFYLLPCRAFELLIGCALSLPGMWRTSNATIARLTGLAGLLLIGWSYHWLNAPTKFPGVTALPACIGAAMIIWSSECASTLTTRLLSFTPAVLVGRWSYSLYLYHWPILFFVNRLAPEHPYGGYIVLALTVAAAWLTYRAVELPARRMAVPAIPTLSYALAGITATALAGLFVAETGGLSWRVDAKVSYYTSFLKYENGQQFRTGTCFLNPAQSFVDLKPECLATSERPILALWGDSGIAQYSSELERAAKTRGYDFRQVTSSACPPAVDLDVPSRPHCRDFNDRALEHLIALRPAIVVLGAAWPGQLEVYDHVETTIDRLQNAGLHVVVLGLGPAYKMPVPTLLADRYKANNPNLLSGDDLMREWTLATDTMFHAKVDRHPPARYVSIIGIVCPNKECPLLADGIVPTHFDELIYAIVRHRPCRRPCLRPWQNRNAPHGPAAIR
jgi:peptidoglycan/LPS O-acetylase OafA/YrhL